MRRLLVVPLLLVAGCPHPALPPVERAYPAPTAEALLASLQARQKQLRTLRTDTKVDFRDGNERVKVKVGMLLERGGKLRLEMENSLVGAVATLVADGAQFALLDIRNNRFLTGPATACNVARLIRIELPPAEIVDVLMGDAPLDGTPARASWEPTRGGREVLELALPDGGTQRVELDGRDHRWDPLFAERRDAAGAVLWSVTHEDFEPQDGGVRLPKRTNLVEPPHGADARIRFLSVEPNIPANPAPFHLTPPPNLRIDQVTCSP